jgi:hypothetical protein
MTEMLQNENTKIENDNTPNKKKYVYNAEKHKLAMKTYRAKKTEAYVRCQKEANTKYRTKMSEYAKKYREMLNNNKLPIEVN